MTTAEAAPPEIQSPLKRLTPEQIEEIGEEFQKIHDEVFDSLGERDAKYIHSIIGLQRRLALLGRVELFGARYWPTWILGTATLSMAKILENMEIGHNVMHGQWDWMNDPQIHSSTWDWDTASTKEAWKHSHNYIHHTYTNIRGKDKDLGYEIMRIDPHQRWHPVYLLQPFYNLLLMFLFEWGVAFHDLDFDAIRSGEKSQKQVLHELKGIAGKARTQVTKDYIAWPVASALVVGAVHAAIGPALARRGESRRDKARRVSLKLFRKALRRPSSDARLAFALDAAKQSYKATLWADVLANIVRNLWAHSIIFCGHFPDQTYTFSQKEVEDETKGAWYIRQLIGAANIDGSPLFHVISGNLGYQVEHHLYPDMPSTRYGEIAPRVREICERYGLPYNTGPLSKQLGMVHRTIIRLAFPGGKPRPKPGPYRGGLQRPGESGAQTDAVAAAHGNGSGA
jgi:NADPH-dependent stearoyl-CoA 9-desaturase